MFRSLLLSIALSSSLTAALAADVRPAVSDLTVDAGGPRALSGHIWYPTRAEGEAEVIGASRVWQPIRGHRDAVPAPGRYPLVVLSHGMYGNSFNQAWLARALVARGMIVAQPNHPGSTTFDKDPARSARIWERPQDITRTIDALLADPRLGPLIDPGRIAVGGHSLGGWTTMMVAGARMDLPRLVSACAEDADRQVCRAMDQLAIGTAPDTASEAARSRHDPRVRAAFTLDIGGTQMLSQESLASLETPVLILGAGQDDWLPQDTESRLLAKDMAGTDVTHVENPQASHFAYMGLCTDQGLAILREVEPDDAMVCIDGTGLRERIHRDVADRVLHFLDRAFGPAS